MGPVFEPVDALVYTAGVDRSPTEVAALFLADHPDGDAVAFLVQALGLDEDAAAEAVSWIPEPEQPADDVGTTDGTDGTDAGTGGAQVELTAEGLAGLPREALVDIAKAAGITVGNKGAERLTSEILEVVAWADAVDAASQEG